MPAEMTACGAGNGVKISHASINVRESDSCLTNVPVLSAQEVRINSYTSGVLYRIMASVSVGHRPVRIRWSACGIIYSVRVIMAG